MTAYVHGYSERESERLSDQASTLADLLHRDSRFPEGARVLEAGCGTGAQTVILARANPGVRFTSVDLSAASLALAEERVRREGLRNVEFALADIDALPFEDGQFDHLFVCFVLEHLRDPGRALASLRRVLRPGGTLTSIEGDHGSCYFHPETVPARRAWSALIECQARLGGDSLIGRRLYPLLGSAGFQVEQVSPRLVYADASRPAMVDGFVRKTIIAMVEGVREQALQLGLVDRESWKQGIADLNRVADSPEGTFCYTFFKAVARRR